MEKQGTKIKRNLTWAMFSQVALIAMNFILPRLYLDEFGSDVNGVLQTMKQIFSYVMLLEAGIGLASTQALYKPVAENDHKRASAILSATHSYYTKIGFIYAAVVLLIAVVYSFYIPSVPESINDWELFAFILLNGVPALVSFFVQAKYRILMEVDGRNYVLTGTETAVQFAANIGKMLVIFLLHSIALLQLVYCLISVAQLIFIVAYAKKKYQWVDLSCKPDFSAISQSKSVLVHKISALVFNSTDIMLLSFTIGPEAASVYSIYNNFFFQVQTLIISVITGFSFALGQMFQVDREKFRRIFHVYETFYIMAAFIIYTLMAVFLLPLVEIYTQGIEDAQYSVAPLVILFVLMNLLSNGKLPSNHVLEYSGMFEATRSHAVIEMIINLSVSVMAIMKWGICGAIIGTIAALAYRGTMMIYYANRKVLGQSVWHTYKHWVVNGAVFALIMCIFYVDTFSGASFWKLVLNGLLHTAWIVPLYVVVNFVCNRKAFAELLSLYREKKQL